MNFFEKQFRRMLWGSDLISSPFYMDGVCFGTLGKDHLVQMEFLVSEEGGYLFDVLEIVVVRRAGGQQTTVKLQLKDILGGKVIFRGAPREVASHWFDVDNWISYNLTQADWNRLYGAVKDCLEGFCTPCPAPKLVYICAPLRGNVEENIEFARQKAREIFLAGEIPICPHLMFPPIADPGNPSEDQAAREMDLQLVALCRQVNVYGICTAGMRAEIDLAQKLGIPVKFMGERQQ